MNYGWEPAPLNTIDAPFQKWLSASGNLTALLQSVGAHQFQLIQQTNEKIPHEEQDLLSQTSIHGHVRQIIHTIDDYPAVCARTVVSDALYQQYKRDFDHLGTKPIGQTLLYNKENISRSPFEFGLVNHDSFLMSLFPKVEAVLQYPSRRSIFTTAQKTLCITEIFLPIMKQYDFM